MRSIRRYGLFKRVRGEKRWTRCYPSESYPLDNARRIFQDALLDGTLHLGLEMALRPVSSANVKEKEDE